MYDLSKEWKKFLEETKEQRIHIDPKNKQEQLWKGQFHDFMEWLEKKDIKNREPASNNH